MHPQGTARAQGAWQLSLPRVLSQPSPHSLRSVTTCARVFKRQL